MSFLQHGVMYMVSLDSESRSFFKPMKTEGKYRVVTSSVEEARHFIELGGYDPETIYVCGLPKFDRNTLNEDADKIVVMLHGDLGNITKLVMILLKRSIIRCW